MQFRFISPFQDGNRVYDVISAYFVTKRNRGHVGYTVGTSIMLIVVNRCCKVNLPVRYIHGTKVQEVADL